MKISDIQKLAKALNGVPLYGCLPGSPGDLAGLKAGDIILVINGERIQSIDDYLRVSSDVRDMEVTVFRDGAELTVGLTKQASTRPLTEVVEFVSQSKYLQAPIAREEEPN